MKGREIAVSGKCHQVAQLEFKYPLTDKCEKDVGYSISITYPALSETIGRNCA